MQDMSQRQLAEIAHIAQSYLAEVEQGRRSIGFDKLCQLADALDVDIVSLVSGVETGKGRSSYSNDRPSLISSP